jgi:hypothetical protein
VTWQTTAVRYLSIGEKSARFRELTLNFNIYGDPVETVIWLPNGGGKSSLMSLESAVVLPAARDFTGAGREDGEKRPRRLDDYVSSGDTSHTVIEWVGADTNDLLRSRHRLLTGAVYEWPNRQRPAIDQAGSLNKMWWSAVPTEPHLCLANLPVRDGRLLTLAQFRDRLRDLNTAHPELQIRIASTQNEWEKQLAELGIDTALYRYQARMNTSEGGIAKVFNFNTVRDFIDLVVDVIATPEQAQDCGNIVTQHAKNLFRRPALLTEQQFLTEAGQLLAELGVAHQLVLDAAENHETAVAKALRLHHALTQTARLADIRATMLREQADRIAEQVTQARRERGQLDGVRAEVVLWGANWRHADAKQRLTRASENEGKCRSDQVAWAAAAPLAEAAGHNARAVELRRQLEPEREAREQLRLRVDAHALAARTLLSDQADDFDEQSTQTGTKVEELQLRRKSIKGTISERQGEKVTVATTKAAAQTHLDTFDRITADLRKAGVLDSDETCIVALNRAQATVDVAEEQAAGYEKFETDFREQAKKAGDAAAAAGIEHQGLAAESKAAQEAEQQLKDRHTRLAYHKQLVALAEADHHIDVWGDAERLRHALTDAAATAEAAALLIAVEAAEDERMLASVDTSGLLPAPAATLAVVHQLNAAGLVAETAWTTLFRDYSEANRLRAVTARPDVVSGVVIQDEIARKRALSVLATDPTLAHIPLVTSEDLAHAVSGDAYTRLPAVPLHDGLHITNAATAAAEHLRAIEADRESRRASLLTSAKTARDLLDELTTFWHTYPNPHSLEAAQGRSATAHAAAEKKLAGQTQLASERHHLEKQAEAARTQASEARAQASHHHLAAARLAPVVETEKGLDEHQNTVKIATKRENELAAEIASLESQRDTIDQELHFLAIAQQKQANQASQTRDRARNLTVLDPGAPPKGDAIAAAKAAGLEPCIATFEALSSRWQIEASDSVLEAQLKIVTEQAEKALGRADQILAQFDGDQTDACAEAERRSITHASIVCESAAAAANLALQTAIAETAVAETALEQARTVLDKARAARVKVQRTTASVEFEDADAAERRAEELAESIAELTSRENSLASKRDDIAHKAEGETQLADSLRDQAERLTSEGQVTDLLDVEPFTGDLTAARTAARQASERCNTTRDELLAAKTERAEYRANAVKLAAIPAYQCIMLTLRERLADSDPIRLGAKADEYAEQVATRLSTVEDLLKQIRDDEQRIGQLVCTHTRQLLSNLAGAARASKLPDGLADMSAKQFLNLRFDNPTEEELASRVAQQVITLLSQAGGNIKSLPSGEKILRQCVHAAVGVKGFRVDVLKPNEHMLEQRVPVTDVARFSDGEKLTTCVLLYCAFAHMRQQGRAGGATGTLMLDNPFGRASNAQLVALQLAVAKAQRVHLVYATGLEDMGALTQFRGIIRLRNRKPVGSTDGHVQFEAGRVGEVNGVHVTRPTAPVPPGLDAPPAAAELIAEKISQ